MYILDINCITSCSSNYNLDFDPYHMLTIGNRYMYALYSFVFIIQFSMLYLHRSIKYVSMNEMNDKKYHTL